VLAVDINKNNKIKDKKVNVTGSLLTQFGATSPTMGLPSQEEIH